MYIVPVLNDFSSSAIPPSFFQWAQVNTLKYLKRITRIKFAILVHNCKYTIQNTWTQLQVHDYRQTIPPSPHATLTAIVLWVATLAVSFISARRFTAYRWKRSFMHVMTLRVLFYYPVYSLLNVFGKVLDRADLNYVRLQTVHNQGLQCCIAITILILIIWPSSSGEPKIISSLLAELSFNFDQYLIRYNRWIEIVDKE